MHADEARKVIAACMALPVLEKELERLAHSSPHKLQVDENHRLRDKRIRVRQRRDEMMGIIIGG